MRNPKTGQRLKADLDSLAQACDEQECRNTLKSWDDLIH